MESFKKHDDFAEMTREERVMALNNTADSIYDEYSYSRPLTKKEIAGKNSELNQALSKIRTLEDERKAINEQMKAYKETIQENNKEILRGVIEANERVWELYNTESGYLEKVNADGFIVESQKVAAGSAVNQNIFRNKKTG